MPDVGDVLLERYELTALIGRGGFGSVFGGRDRVLGRDVAIKVLNEPSHEDDERFQREARIVAALESERVVRLFEAGVDATGAPFLVMERLRGLPLNVLLRQRGGALPVTEAVDLAIEACAGLGEAHAHGIVHRDIKPGNLFMAERRDGTRLLKVLDFGIAKWSHAPALTGDQVMMGTLRYTAPEQIRDAKTADARADVWSIGVVLYEMLSGGVPFESTSDAAMGALVLVADPIRLSTRLPAVADGLEAIVHRCIERRPEDRFASVGALAVALAPFASDAGRRLAVTVGEPFVAPTAPLPSPSLPYEVTVGATVTHTPRPAVLTTKPRRSGRAVIAVIAGAVVVLAAGAALGWNALRAPPPSSAGATAVVEPAASTVAAAPVAASFDARSSASALPSSAPPPSAAPSSARVVPKVRPSATSATSVTAEQRARFLEACLSVSSAIPVFLSQGGPAPYVCGKLAGEGCSSVGARCSVRESEREREQCAAFQQNMRNMGGCP